MRMPEGPAWFAMAEILSQQEIDALLNAFDTGDVTKAGETKDDASSDSPHIVKPYDFRRPDKFSKHQIRTINMIMEGFGRSFGTALSAKLRSLVSLQVVSIDQLTYGEFLMSISDPSVIGIFSMAPLDGHAIFEMTTPTAFYVLEKLLGNKGAGSMVIRTLTEIEEVLISGIISDGLRNLRQSMAGVVEISPKLEDLENNPQFVQVVPPQDMVLLTSIEMKVAENSGMIGICFPYVVVEPILNTLSTEFILSRHTSPGEEEIFTRLMTNTVGKVEVEVVADIGECDFRIEQLLELEAGDVITLSTKTTDDINVYIDGIGRAKFRARTGLVGKHNGIQITEVLPQEYVGEETAEAVVPAAVAEPVEEGTT
jgi:flagellar motor switch protein FliM